MPEHVRYLSVAHVIALYREVMGFFGVPESALVRPEALESAIQRPRAAGYYAGATLVEQAVALGTGIALAHPWVDGNKRCSFAAMVMFLEWNGVMAPSPDSETYLATARLLVEAVATTGGDRGERIGMLTSELDRWAGANRPSDHRE